MALPGGDGQQQGNGHVMHPRSLIEMPQNAIDPKIAELGGYGQRTTHLYNGLAVESDLSGFTCSDCKLIDRCQRFSS